MNLYAIHSEDGIDHVEAASFGEAVSLWRAAKVAEFGEGSGWDDESQPESVHLLDTSPVIREAAK